MLKFSVKKKLNRLLAGILSAAMSMTMVPDIWLPVYADMVREEILEADLQDNINSTENVQSENNVFSANEFTKYEYNGHTYTFIDEGMTWNNAKLYCENIG